jgi:hypothetical protein
MVTTGGSTQVYYNGVAQSVSAVNYNLTNSSAALYIGCRGSNLFQQFIGKLTNIRICSIAKYLSNFVPTQLPVLDAGNTPLLFNPSSRKVQDEGDNGLALVSYGVTYSTDYAPVTYSYTLATAPNAVFTPSLVLVFTNDYPDAGTVPVGAKAVISGTLVTVVQVDINQVFGGNPAVYITTDAAGAVGNNVSITFTWRT